MRISKLSTPKRRKKIMFNGRSSGVGIMAQVVSLGSKAFSQSFLFKPLSVVEYSEIGLPISFASYLNHMGS